MKLFIVRSIYFILIFIISIFLLTFIGNKLLDKNQYYKLSDSTKSVILGHSHPECAFNDSLIKNITNLSNSGESYYYTYLKIKKIILNNKQIKNIFIEFTNNEIEQKIDSNTWSNRILQVRLPTYFPLMDLDEIEFLWSKNKKGCLNYFPKSILKNIGRNFTYLIFFKKGFKNEDRFGGYLYLEGSKTDSLINLPINNLESSANLKISETNIAYLSKIINLCKLNGVKAFLIRSPLHSRYNFNNEIEFKKIKDSKFANIEFLDFKNFPLKNSEFRDLEHLNYKGARLFSIFFNNLLNSGLLVKTNKQKFINNEIEKLISNKHNDSIVNKFVANNFIFLNTTFFLR